MCWSVILTILILGYWSIYFVIAAAIVGVLTLMARYFRLHFPIRVIFKIIHNLLGTVAFVLGMLSLYYSLSTKWRPGFFTITLSVAKYAWIPSLMHIFTIIICGYVSLFCTLRVLLLIYYISVKYF